MIDYPNTIYWYGLVIVWLIYAVYYGASGESRTTCVIVGLLYAIIWPVLPLYALVLLAYYLYTRMIKKIFKNG